MRRCSECSAKGSTRSPQRAPEQATRLRPPLRSGKPWQSAMRYPRTAVPCRFMTPSNDCCPELRRMATRGRNRTARRRRGQQRGPHLTSTSAATTAELCAASGFRNGGGTVGSRSAIRSVGASAPNELNYWLPDLGSNQEPRTDGYRRFSHFQILGSDSVPQFAQIAARFRPASRNSRSFCGTGMTRSARPPQGPRSQRGRRKYRNDDSRATHRRKRPPSRCNAASALPNDRSRSIADPLHCGKSAFAGFPGRVRRHR